MTLPTGPTVCKLLGRRLFRTSPGPKASPLEVSGVVGETIDKQTSLSILVFRIGCAWMIMDDVLLAGR